MHVHTRMYVHKYVRYVAVHGAGGLCVHVEQGTVLLNYRYMLQLLQSVFTYVVL